MKTLVLLGAGGHAQVVADAALASGKWSAIRWHDDDTSLRPLVGDAITGSIDAFFGTADRGLEVALGIGSGKLRRELLSRLVDAGFVLPPIVHPQACVSGFAAVLDGAVVLAGGIVNVGATVGSGAIVNTAASVDHHCRIGTCAHIGPGARLAGDVSIGERTWIGIGASVIEGVNVGARAIVGAGAVVVGDIPEDVVATGVPARVRRSLLESDP